MYKFNIELAGEMVTVQAHTPHDAKEAGVNDWSLRVLQRIPDMQKQRHYISALYDALLQAGVVNAYAPSVAAASALIIDSEDLTTRFNFGRTRLHRNSDMPADGVFIEPGEAFVFTAAGCPSIVAKSKTQGKKFTCVAHAGRASLIDEGILRNSPTRSYMSIVDAIVREFKLRDVPPSEVHMALILAIPQRVFDHPLDDPKYSDHNRKLLALVNEKWPGSMSCEGNHAYLSIPEVFIQQARSLGVKEAWAASDMDAFPELTHTRDGGNPLRRNLVIIKNDA